MENPRDGYVQGITVCSLTHDFRSRQLRTNHNHAALAFMLTREYQNDSPSTIASPLTSGLPQQGP